jgi:hypothetical protein
MPIISCTHSSITFRIVFHQSWVSKYGSGCVLLEMKSISARWLYGMLTYAREETWTTTGEGKVSMPKMIWDRETQN